MTRIKQLQLVGQVTLALAALAASPAGAVLWDIPAGAGSGCTTLFSGDTGCTSWSITNSTYTAKMRAYSTASAASPDTTPAGNWLTADMVYYSGAGMGITNRVSDAGEGGTPEHAIDNNGSYDVMVIELPQLTNQTWDINAFMLGWAREGTNPSTDPHSADVQVWFGGANLGANYDFKNACFTAGNCTNSGTGSAAKGDLAYLGFTDVSSAIASNGVGSCTGNTGGTDVCEFGSATINGNQAPGNYMIVSGRLGDSMDAFKLKTFDASTITKTAPIPGTVPLMMLGLAGLVGLSRRRSKGSAA